MRTEKEIIARLNILEIEHKKLLDYEGELNRSEESQEERIDAGIKTLRWCLK